MQTKVSDIIQLVHVSKCLHLYWPWKASLPLPSLLWDLGRGLSNFMITHIWNIFSSSLQRYQRVKASSPHIHLPTNPDLSNHCTLTYWRPCWANCLAPPPSSLMISLGNNLEQPTPWDCSETQQKTSLASFFFSFLTLLISSCMNLSNKEGSFYLPSIITQEHSAPPCPRCLSCHSLCCCNKLSSSSCSISARKDSSAGKPAATLPWLYILENFHRLFFPFPTPELGGSHKPRLAPSSLTDE